MDSLGNPNLQRVPDELPELLVLLGLVGGHLGEEVEGLLDEGSLKLVDEAGGRDGVSRDGEAAEGGRRKIREEKKREREEERSESAHGRSSAGSNGRRRKSAVIRQRAARNERDDPPSTWILRKLSHLGI